jgi:hypothetical protein
VVRAPRYQNHPIIFFFHFERAYSLLYAANSKSYTVTCRGRKEPSPIFPRGFRCEPLASINSLRLSFSHSPFSSSITATKSSKCKMSANTNSSASRSKYVTLVSSEGFEFVVLREAAYVSPTVKKMLDPTHGWTEAQTGRCVFEEIRYASLTFLLLLLFTCLRMRTQQLAAFFLKDQSPSNGG